MAVRDTILNLAQAHFAEAWPERPFRPGVDPVPVAGKVFDAEDVKSLLDASLDFWLTAGRYAGKISSSNANSTRSRPTLSTRPSRTRSPSLNS